MKPRSLAALILAVLASSCTLPEGSGRRSAPRDGTPPPKGTPSGREMGPATSETSSTAPAGPLDEVEAVETEYSKATSTSEGAPATSGFTADTAAPHGDFSSAEQWVSRFEGPERDAWQRPTEVIALLAVEPGMAVADIGAGTGYFVPYLSRAVGETGSVLALDAEADMVRHIDRRAEEEELFNVRPQLVPPDDPYLPEAGVDRVLIVNTWHHLRNRRVYAEKLARGLKSAGKVCVIDVTEESPVGPPKDERLPPETVVSELEAGGLSARIVETETLPHQYVVIGVKR